MDPASFTFNFQWNDDLDCAAASYWTDQLRVNPKTLFQSYAVVQKMADTEAETGITLDD